MAPVAARLAGAGVIALVDNASIAFDDVGSGYPVVFLHAFPLNRTMWDPQTSALVAECRCIAIDMRGAGESPPTPPYSMDRFADDVAGVLDTLRIERAVIVGLSHRRLHRLRALAAASAPHSRAGAGGHARRGRTPSRRVERRRTLIETGGVARKQRDRQRADRVARRERRRATSGPTSTTPCTA